MNHDTKTSFLVFLFVLGALILSQRTNAAMSISPTVSGYGGGMLSSPSGGHTMTPANDGYIKPTVVNVGAKQITVPATMRMAANAGNMAKQGMRLTPLGVIGTLAAGWLLQEGMEYLNGEWNKSYTGPGAGYTSAYAGASPPCSGTPSYVVSCVENAYSAITGQKAWRQISPTQWQYYRVSNDAGITVMTVSNPGSSYQPATQDDWDALPDPLPAVAPELPYAPYMPGGVPVEAPEYEFIPFQVPVGDPYTKPDGSTSQPMASVSPNGDAITIDTYDLPLTDAQGNPIASPTPQDTPEPQPDTSKNQCEQFPNSLGCSELGTVDDLAVGTETRSIAAISPVSVGGVGACPAPLTASFMGQTVSFSYDMPCQFATSLKPLILAIAWLSAGLIFIGGVRQ